MRILGGEFKGRTLPTLEGDGCRPAMGKVREALFSMLEARGHALGEARVLDVFAGTGSLGLEALSRGAAHACFLEKNRTLAKRIEENCRRLGLDRSRYAVLAADALAALAKSPPHGYHVVFVDPPYGLGLLAPALDLLTSRGWLVPEAAVAAEVEARLNPDACPRGLTLEADRTYGQTRICIWSHTKPSPSTPAPSTP